MADITDEQIAAAVRPLYADDTAASMGLADDIRTVRAVLALREQEASATGAATDDTLWKRRAYHLDRELKAARVDVDSEIVEGQLADFLLKFGGKYDGNGMWEVSLHLEEICQIMSALATPTTSTTGKVDASRVRDEAWQPIETAPNAEQRDMFVVRAFNVSRWNYTSDAYCVWRDIHGGFARWPHQFAPTHWMPLPAPPVGTPKSAEGEGA
jgi:hypothetical protein